MHVRHNRKLQFRRFARLAGISLVFASTAVADLQNVDVGGQLRIRARYWSNMFVDGDPEVRIPEFFLPGRPIGSTGTASELAWDDQGNDLTRFEQHTWLRFRADFTSHVAAQVDLFSLDTWGSDHRADYLTGMDSRSDTSSDIEFLQSYVEVDALFGAPLRLRAGRQQIELGDGWLVGNSHSTDEFAFDGLRLSYDAGPVTIDGWWTKLAEGGAAEQDGDVDFYGLNATYRGLRHHEILAYWLFMRDGRSISDTNFVAPLERLEDWVRVDDYDPTEMHTFGVRIQGAWSSWDHHAEVAYQTGNADSVGHLFAPFGYGDTAARFDSWAWDAEIGFTFDAAWQPRVFVGGAYLGGDDERDLNSADWLNPFDRPDASVSFNRLFSSTKYGELFGQDRDASNFRQLRVGVDLQPFEPVSLTATAMRFWVNEPFDMPRSLTSGGFRIPLAPALPFMTERADDDVGTITSLDLRYRYSEELEFRLVAEYLFADDGVGDGSFVYNNGLAFNGGSDSDNATYLAVDALLAF